MNSQFPPRRSPTHQPPPGTLAAKQPRGIRNNNPGNIEWGDPWQGLVPRDQANDTRFAVFKAPAWGIRALARVLITYFDKHKIVSVRGAITRWAPPVENDTEAYIRTVAKAVGVGANEPINVHKYDILRPMVEAIIRHENGAGPLKTANSWYAADVIDEGLRLAGVVKPVKAAIMTPQGAAAATAATAAGTAAVVEIAQQITPIVQQVQTVSTASQGLPTWLRVTMIVLTLAAAGAAAWAFWSKRRELKAVQP